MTRMVSVFCGLNHRQPYDGADKRSADFGVVDEAQYGARYE